MLYGVVGMSIKASWLFIGMMICFASDSGSVQGMMQRKMDTEAATKLLLMACQNLPIELKKRILRQVNTDQQEQIKATKKLFYKNMFSKSLVQYLMSYEPPEGYASPEGLIYAQNLMTTILVKQIPNGSTRDIVPQNGDSCFFDTQFWVRKKDKSIRVSQDTTGTNHVIICELPNDLIINSKITTNVAGFGCGLTDDFLNDFKEYFIVDGVNAKGKNTGIIGVFSEDKKKSAIYVTDIIIGKESESAIKPFCAFNGLLCTVMMHPEQNCIAYSFYTYEEYSEKPIEKELIAENDVAVKMPKKKKKKKRNEQKRRKYQMHIVKNAYPMNTNNSIELLSSPLDYYTSVDFGCKKISLFGGNTFIFLTLEGKIGMCWLEKDQDNTPSLKWSVKKGLEKTYIDFAPDVGRPDEQGFTPNWAFLTENGEIFCWNFEILQPAYTLYLAKQAPKPDNYQKFDKVYYQDGKCGAVYTESSFGRDVPQTKLILFS
ncbi:MAG TPA: hypothetical protein VL201_03670 [Patescibacteria group bacterium]|jgi:hypothetical protein|nr:hypothetical protein [Patescibacteria group bacterium]